MLNGLKWINEAIFIASDGIPLNFLHSKLLISIHKGSRQNFQQTCKLLLWCVLYSLSGVSQQYHTPHIYHTRYQYWYLLLIPPVWQTGGRCYLADLLLLTHHLHQGCHTAVPHLHQGYLSYHTVLTSNSSVAKEFKIFVNFNFFQLHLMKIR